MAQPARRRRERRPADGRNKRNPRARDRARDQQGILPLLARAAREVELAVRPGVRRPSVQAKYQAVALLARQERARVRADSTLGEAQRDTALKRLDGIAVILAQIATRDPSLLALLEEDAAVPEATRSAMRDLLRGTGIDVDVVEVAPPPPSAPAQAPPRPAVSPSVVSRQLANPFLAPDFSAAATPVVPVRRLTNWDLSESLFRAFEEAPAGAPACMSLPEASAMNSCADLDLMPHQARVIAATEAGHRTFLLADEPGLGKTAQALLAAQAAGAYPLLCVVPNVVKANWAREVGLWTPTRTATVIHGDGETIDGFADVVIVNYEVLDRHVDWIGRFGFRGMIVDEAHFIKNKTSQRSQHVLELSDRIRGLTMRPLLMALTGTPLINDIEDFRAIWQFLGWIDGKNPRRELMGSLEETGMTPIDPGFYPAARQCVLNMGIVRRRKVDVAKDIPARRVVDLPVELDDKLGRSIRRAEQRLAKRMVSRYRAAIELRAAGESDPDGIDHDLVRAIATRERKEAANSKAEGNVFGVLRKIGQAKAVLAADYAAQVARSAGKVVFFAKHIDVMDAAQEAFTKAGVRFSAIRGDQTAKARQAEIDAFVEDPDIAIAVCSLTAAGVGLNLQVASNIVLAELSWTAAEQTQAIDRCHRIGQAEPVTAWRILAAQTIDARVAELIDSKAGLAARALDGEVDEDADSGDVQLAALVGLLTDALSDPSFD